MRTRLIALTAGVALALGWRVAAGQIVEIRLHGYYYSEPATVRVTVAVEPNQANRLLRVEADGDRLFRSTDTELAGDGEKRLHVIEFKNLPAGTYELTAQVLANDASVRGQATQELLVSGMGGR